MDLILINNKFVKPSHAKISVLSEAFMYGYGVFETLRTFDKKIIKANEHINRLLNSAKKIELKIKYKKSEILKMLLKITEKSPFKNQRIKITAIKEGIIITSKKLTINKSIYKGVSVKTVLLKRSMPEIKSISYLESYFAHQQAVKQGYFEAILTDEKDEIYEGSYSNIFWFRGDTLCTRKDHVLAGITAQTVIKNSPFKVKFKKITLKNLLKSHEIFLTQTTTGIVPITKINNQKIGTGKPGIRTEKLLLRRSLLL